MGSVTIKDIAKLADVSCATVSRVLNDAPGVNAETREKVLALCRQQGYRRNLLARTLSASHAGIISCIVSVLKNPLFTEFFFALEQTARRLGYHVMLCYGRAEDPDIRQLFDFLIGHHVDGIIFVSSSRQAPELIRLYADRVPIVLQGMFDLPVQEMPVPAVCVDNITGGRIAAEYLYKLGHREVAYVGLRESNVSHSLRYRGFAEAAQRLGMSVQVSSNVGLSSTIDVGYQLSKEFFFDNYHATAMFAACDSIAMGVMAAAKEFHISIPEEISILGFDNINYSSLPNIRLTTLDCQKDLLAKTAIGCLLERIGANEPLDSQPRMIPPLLLERTTCRSI